MRWGFMICPEMFGNGCLTGMAKTITVKILKNLSVIQRDHQRESTEFIGGVAGAMARICFAQVTVVTPDRNIGTAAWDFVLQELHSLVFKVYFLF